MPVGIRAKLEDTGVASNEPVRARADGKRIALCCDAPPRVLAPDNRELEVREKRGVGLVQHELDRLRVGDPHLRNSSVSVRVPASKRWIDHPLEGGNDIVGVEHAAVAKAQAASKLDDELGWALGFHGFGEVRNHLEGARVDRDQGREEQTGDAEAVGVADEPRVELLGVAREHHHQSIRVALGRGRAAEADC